MNRDMGYAQKIFTQANIIRSRNKMASEKEYLNLILERLSELKEITYRVMMGEYLLYYNGRLFGGIYDNRFLVKINPSSTKLLDGAPEEAPYDGAKHMLLVTEAEDKDLMCELITAMYDELPEKRSKKEKRENKK